MEGYSKYQGLSKLFKKGGSGNSESLIDKNSRWLP